MFTLVSMQTIQVDKRFVLTQQDGTTREFLPGRHEVDDDTASHWYVQAHSTQAVAPTEAFPKIDPPPTPTPPKIPVPPPSKTK